MLRIWSSSTWEIRFHRRCHKNKIIYGFLILIETLTSFLNFKNPYKSYFLHDEMMMMRRRRLRRRSFAVYLEICWEYDDPVLHGKFLFIGDVRKNIYWFLILFETLTSFLNFRIPINLIFTWWDDDDSRRRLRGRNFAVYLDICWEYDDPGLHEKFVFIGDVRKIKSFTDFWF